MIDLKDVVGVILVIIAIFAITFYVPYFVDRFSAKPVIQESTITIVEPWFSARMEILPSGKLIVNMIGSEGSEGLIGTNLPPLKLVMDEWDQELENYVVHQITENPEKYRHLLEEN